MLKALSKQSSLENTLKQLQKEVAKLPLPIFSPCATDHPSSAWDCIVSLFGQYNSYFMEFRKKLKKISKSLAEKAEEKAVKYSLQRVTQIEDLLEGINAQQAIMDERVRNSKLEERMIEYIKDKEIQEERYREIMQSSYNVARCAEELRSIIKTTDSKHTNSINLQNVQSIIGNDRRFGDIRCRTEKRKFITTSFMARQNASNRKLNASFRSPFKDACTPISKLLGTTTIREKQAKSESRTTPKAAVRTYNFEDSGSANPFIKIYGKIKTSNRKFYTDQ